MHIRTNKFVKWDEFLESSEEKNSFTLDFEIDAGFSFSTAVALRWMSKGKNMVSKNETINFSNIDLILNYPLKELDIQINGINLNFVSNYAYDSTDRYFVSVNFSLLNLNSITLKGMLEKDALENPKLDGEIRTQRLLTDFFGKKAQAIMGEVISYIELSGYYARQVPSTLNLYINDDKKGFLKLVQMGGGVNSAGNNPIHPLSIKSKDIISNYKKNSSIPQNIKDHFKKGIHYNFLGFHDESFLCFYKIIETIFKEKRFSKNLAKKIFNSESEAVVNSLKSSNQKTMMLFIYQLFILEHHIVSDEQRNDLMTKMLLASDARNKIAHSSDNSEESKRLLPFLIPLSKFMISSIS